MPWQVEFICNTQSLRVRQMARGRLKICFQTASSLLGGINLDGINA
ncbi:hypothetical protein [Neisseria dumasiana]|nr:hypothetical protein [Neisseria dumasiana]